MAWGAVLTAVQRAGMWAEARSEEEVRGTIWASPPGRVNPRREARFGQRPAGGHRRSDPKCAHHTQHVLTTTLPPRLGNWRASKPPRFLGSLRRKTHCCFLTRHARTAPPSGTCSQTPPPGTSRFVLIILRVGFYVPASPAATGASRIAGCACHRSQGRRPFAPRRVTLSLHRREFRKTAIYWARGRLAPYPICLPDFVTRPDSLFAYELSSAHHTTCDAGRMRHLRPKSSSCLPLSIQHA